MALYRIAELATVNSIGRGASRESARLVDALHQGEVLVKGKTVPISVDAVLVAPPFAAGA